MNGASGAVISEGKRIGDAREGLGAEQGKGLPSSKRAAPRKVTQPKKPNPVFAGNMTRYGTKHETIKINACVHTTLPVLMEKIST